MKKLARLSIATFVFLFCTFISKAQDATIKGTIKEKSSGKVMPNAVIFILKKDSAVRTLISDASGNYETKVKAGGYSVKVQYIGYSTYRSTLLIAGAGKTIVHNVLLADVSTNQRIVRMEDQSGKKNENVQSQVYGDANVQVETVQDEVEELPDMAPVLYSPPTTNLQSVGYFSSSKNVSYYWYDATHKPDLPQGIAGKLTAGEINDFSKWKMWQDIEANQLKRNQDFWKFYPSEGRYTVQVTGDNGQPVIDCPVTLLNQSGGMEWNARTDNTGKAELWLNLFNTDGKMDGDFSIVATYKGKSYKKEKASSFYKGVNVIRVPAACEVSTRVDVAFVVDATGSMQDEIDYLKTDLNDIIGKVKGKHPELVINMAGMFYRCPGNSFVTKKSDFSTDISKTVSFIKQQNADEGGDEAVETAMDEAVNKLSWDKEARSRIIFLVLDEPPGSSPEILLKLRRAIIDAAEKGIRIIPIVCSGEGYDKDKNLEYLMRCFAMATNGTYVFLTDHSGIGNTHTAPTTDKYNVELLNDVMVRLFEEYTKVAPCKDEMTTQKDSSFTSPHDTLTIMTKAPQDTFLEKKSDTLTKPAPTEEKMTQLLRYYPNPNSGQFYIEPDGEVSEVYISDISGKLVKRIEVKERTSVIPIDISEFASGIYYVKVPDGKEKWLSGKVILER
ncbi:MAG TPA: carboxypeptidase regulatory-like domain-containing protein [Bacteroidia bacterium]